MSEFFTVMDLKKYFWASLFLAIICLAGAVLAVMSSGDADIYVKETIVGDGDWRTHHEGKLSEESGGPATRAVFQKYPGNAVVRARE